MDLIPFLALLFFVISISFVFFLFAIYHGKKKTFKLYRDEIKKELLYKGKLTLGSFYGYVFSALLLAQSLIILSVIIAFQNTVNEKLYTLLIISLVVLNIFAMLWIKKLCSRELCDD